jgi:hypothetical protein
LPLEISQELDSSKVLIKAWRVAYHKEANDFWMQCINYRFTTSPISLTPSVFECFWVCLRRSLHVTWRKANKTKDLLTRIFWQGPFDKDLLTRIFWQGSFTRIFWQGSFVTDLLIGISVVHQVQEPFVGKHWKSIVGPGKPLYFFRDSLSLTAGSVIRLV